VPSSYYHPWEFDALEVLLSSVVISLEHRLSRLKAGVTPLLANLDNQRVNVKDLDEMRRHKHGAEDLYARYAVLFALNCLPSTVCPQLFALRLTLRIFTSAGKGFVRPSRRC
jgi:hypothetical protein